MSTVKISQLPLITALNANTSNSLFMGVDIPTGVTGKFTAHTLAANLFSNEILNVGVNQQNLPNTVAQFSLGGESYIQTNLVNANDGGTADMVVTANVGSGGSDSTNFIDMGWANKDYQAGSEYNNIGNAVRPNDGYLYTQGTSGQVYGNLIIGTTSSGANIKFIVGGGSQQNIVAKMTSTGLVLNTQSSITFSDGTTQSSAAASAAYSSGVNTSQNTNITTANNAAWAGFAKANAALANTDGVYTAGTINVSKNITVNGTFALTNSNFSSTESALTIAATAAVATPSNDGYMIHISGKQNVSSRIVTDSYGANTYVVYAGRSARGTAAAPQAVANGDVIVRISGNAYGTTRFEPTGVGRIDIVATENHTDTARGTAIKFFNMPVGTNTFTNIATFNGDNVTFTGAVNPQKGFIYSPVIYPGAQTAITIDFSNGPVIRAQTATGLIVSFSNLTAGKVVELWLTNTAGNGQTFTHGCSAINSTVNSTTYSIPATSTIVARYISFDGTLANTFVSIIHS